MRARVASAANALTPLQSLIARRWRPQWICHQCRQSPPSSWQPFTTSRALLDDQPKPYYVTTPIFYVNAAPHVGHMYTMILADVLKRWQQLQGRDAILLTGTDEHGMKIQRAAAQAGVAPKDFCDTGADVFKDLARRVDMSNDIFIRTTDERHKQGVEYAWQMLEDRGYIYESKHEGWYSVSDETFYPQTQVQSIVDPPTGRKIMVSIETGKEVEWTSERNYHFRLSAFRQKLLDFYAQNPGYIIPQTRMDDVVKQVTEGLEDLSVSRPSSRLTWGVPVPSDSTQTIYVWLDALLNYATAVGYPFTPGTEASSGWPPDVQVVGKDIIRFHCIYWPAFLMALDLPLHGRVLTHAHWTLGKQKMSKSSGNGVNPFFALDRFGIDAMRWYLIHDGGIANDADYENSFIIRKYKKHLSGGLGNLTSRIVRGRDWSLRNAVKQYAHPEADFRPPVNTNGDDVLRQRWYDRLRRWPEAVDTRMRDLHAPHALRAIMDGVASANAAFQHAAPWTRARALRDPAVRESATAAADIVADVNRSVYLAAETLRLAGILLQPFVPTSAARLLDMLDVAPERRTWEWCRVGKDATYGAQKSGPRDRGADTTLFPPLNCDT